MKLSLAWIFDHIDGVLSDIDVPYLVQQFNQKTAEIESYTSYTCNYKEIKYGRVVSIEDDSVGFLLEEGQKKITLESRKGLVHDAFYLVVLKGNEYVWADMTLFGSSKQLLLPSLSKYNFSLNGVEHEDYIFEVDNKSITHRPDMWSHRGFAREIAIILDLPLKPIDGFLEHYSLDAYLDYAPKTKNNPFTVTLKSSACKRFASLYLPRVENSASQLAIASRLCRVDSRPINLLVDISNYVMQDIGQPLHVFDSRFVIDKSIVIDYAHNQSTMTSLDGDTIHLTDADIVIKNQDEVLSLAGVMGGLSSGVQKDTDSIIIESAAFDPSVIRRSALRYKKRTEASSRFEKSLDPNQNINAIERFMKIVQQSGIVFESENSIISLGDSVDQKKVLLIHKDIEEVLGVRLDANYIQTLLEKLGFLVDYTSDQNTYYITVPTYRGSKDIDIKEDIIEEIGRFYGYSTIPLQAPLITSRSFNIAPVNKIRAAKEFLAFGLQMHELQSYAFFDEAFLSLLDWEPIDSLDIKNPVSQNWYRLVTTLIPHLLRAVQENSAQRDIMRFFEVGRTWKKTGTGIVEHKKVAGIFFDSKKIINFYDAKSYITRFFELFGMNPQWSSVAEAKESWYMLYKTAEIRDQGEIIGCAGMLSEECMQKIVPGGSAFIFEFDVDYIINRNSAFLFQPLVKYPSCHRDLSLLVPLAVSFEEILESITCLDNRIKHVDLIDMFVSDEWDNRKAITIRMVIQDQSKTLTKEEVDSVERVVIDTLSEMQIVIR